MRPGSSSKALTRASSRPPPPFDQSLPACQRAPETTRGMAARDLEGTVAGRRLRQPGSGSLRWGRGAREPAAEGRGREARRCGGAAGTTNPKGRLPERRKGRSRAGRSEARGALGPRPGCGLSARGDHVRRQQLQPDPEPGHPHHSEGGPRRRRAAAPRGLQHHPRRHAFQHHPRR